MPYVQVVEEAKRLIHDTRKTILICKIVDALLTSLGLQGHNATKQR